jgi:hypothetical protein
MEMYIPAIKNRNFISKCIEPARAVPDGCPGRWMVQKI